MGRKYFWIVIIILSLGLNGCLQRQDNDTIQKIENIIDLAPDSVYNVLCGFGYNEECDEIRPRMMMRYVTGVMAHDSGNYSKSIISLSKSLDNAKVLDNHYWMGKNAMGMTKIFKGTYNYADWYYYAIKGYEYMRKSGKQPDINRALLDLATSAYCCENYNEAEMYSRQLIDSAKIYKDKQLLLEGYRLLGKTLINKKEYKKASSVWKNLIQIGNSCIDDTIAYLICNLTIDNNDINSVCLDQVKIRECDISPWLSLELAKIIGDSGLYYRSQQNIFKLGSEKFSQISHLPIVAMTANHYISVAEKNIETNKQIVNKSRSVIILIMILTIVLIILIYKWHKYKIVSLISVHENEKDRQLRGLMIDTYREWDSKCKLFYAYGNTKHGKELATDIKNIVEYLHDPQNLTDIEIKLNTYQSNLMSDFRNDLPMLKDADYKLFLYTILGFSIPSIALLLGEKKIDGVYNRKGRLKIKIKKLEDEKCMRYIKALK